jgi:hypothetical protein
MNPLRHSCRAICIYLSLILGMSAPAFAGSEDDDWTSFSRVLAVVQSLVRLAANSEDERAVQRGMEDILAGKNANANRLFSDMLSDVPAEQRRALQSLGRDFATLAARERARNAQTLPGTRSAGEAIAARKELAQMGLRYHDAGEYLDAVKRGDLLAVDLYISGRGVNLNARDATGASALEVAKREGNTQMARILAAAGVN